VRTPVLVCAAYYASGALAVVGLQHINDGKFLVGGLFLLISVVLYVVAP
jgi:hypothetical protein